jgi:hypothetical protein
MNSNWLRGIALLLIVSVGWYYVISGAQLIHPGLKRIMIGACILVMGGAILAEKGE